MNLTSQFEYEKLSRQIDECEDIEFLREKCKDLIKLYFIQKETTLKMFLVK